MKKSELTQLTQIVEFLVKREIKKQLPQIMTEVFKGMVQKSLVTEHIQPIVKDAIGKEVEAPEVTPDPLEFRASLKEAFAGIETEQKVDVEPRPFKNYTKNPLLNKILNETTSDLRSKEGLGAMAAYQGGFNPAVLSGAPGAASMLTEGQAPLDSLPAGISALDVAQRVPLKPEVKNALTKNYSSMMKLIDQKKGKK